MSDDKLALQFLDEIEGELDADILDEDFSAEAVSEGLRSAGLTPSAVGERGLEHVIDILMGQLARAEAQNPPTGTSPDSGTAFDSVYAANQGDEDVEISRETLRALLRSLLEKGR